MKEKLMGLLSSGLLNKSLKVLLLRILGVFMLFSTTLFLTNYYSAESVGKYDFARSSILILGGICMLGTNQSIIYFSGLLKAKQSIGSLKGVYYKMIFLVFCISSTFIAIYFLIDPDYLNILFNKPSASDIIFKICLGLFFFAFTLLNIDMIRALNRTIFSEWFRNIFRYLPFFLLAVLLYKQELTEYLISVYLLGFVILCLVSFIFIFLELRKLGYEKADHPISFKEIFLVSYPMALSALSHFLMQSVDTIILSKYQAYETVAYYSVAVKLATVTALALQSVNIIIAPKIAEIFNSDNISPLKVLLKQSARLIFITSVPVIFFLAVFAKNILSFFGEEYTQASVALQILLFGQLFNSLCGPVGVYMNMTGKQNQLQKILFLGLVINVVLNIIYIPKYGMIGASASTACSIIIWNIVASAYTYKKDKIRTFLS